MNVKQECAKAAMEYIQSGMVIGLGGGSTISYLIDFIKNENIKVKVVTPSLKTKLLCLEQGLEVLPACVVEQIDVAFDGCDQVDEKLHALKSAGGIHTQEKLIAKMSKDYILLADVTKFVPTLTYDHPVTLEILQESLSFVLKKAEALGGKPVVRTGSEKDGYTISDNGNFLVDVYFQAEQDSKQLENKLTQIAGVIDVSLFTTVVTKVLVAGENGVKAVTK
ncbi:ribose 5-phosphate isomerase A [Bacillus gobiensis]|uniref:ribose 5-phosphate isomerase A n=1 Tax=Bacillus gobiensis TaxID=1441095 RepID=UPI003D249271